MSISTTVASDVRASSASAAGVLRALMGAAALGLVVFYGVAFAESPLLHNAAHDVRHITVKPCH